MPLNIETKPKYECLARKNKHTFYTYVNDFTFGYRVSVL